MWHPSCPQDSLIETHVWTPQCREATKHQAKGCSRKVSPFINSFIHSFYWGLLVAHSFPEEFCFDRISFQREFYIERLFHEHLVWSDTVTLSHSNLGGLLLEQSLGWHSVPFPHGSPLKDKLKSTGSRACCLPGQHGFVRFVLATTSGLEYSMFGSVALRCLKGLHKGFL